MVKSLNPHLMNIDVVKLDGMNNFRMWRCEVMDTFDGIKPRGHSTMKKKSKEISEKNWNKMNG